MNATIVVAVRQLLGRGCVAAFLTLELWGCTSLSVVVNQTPPGPSHPTGYERLRAGAAEVDITPPPGLPVWGSDGAAVSRTAGYRMRLFVRAIAFEDPRGERLVLVQADLGAMSDLLHRRVAARLSDLGLGPDRVLIAATHTHGAPGGYFGSRFYNSWAAARGGFDDEVVEWLESRIDEVVRRAFADLAPARVAASERRLDGVSRNRSREAWERNFPSGPPPLALDEVDKTIRILRVDHVSDNDAVPIAAFVVFAVHGTAASVKQELLHGDLQAVAAEFLRRKVTREFSLHRGFVAAFANGAEGDVSPNWKGWPDPSGQGFSEADRLGKSLADGAFEAFRDPALRFEDQLALDHAYREATIPNAVTAAGSLCGRAVLGLPVLGGAEDGRSFLYGLFGVAEGTPRRSPAGCQGFKRTALGFLQGLLVKPRDFTRIAPFQVFRLGRVITLATVPGEPTTETGRGILEILKRASPSDVQAVVGHANAYIGYVATQAEYDAQHYEGASTLYGPFESLFVSEQIGALATSLDSKSIVDFAPERAFLPGSSKRFWGDPKPCRSQSWTPVAVDVHSDYVMFDWRGLEMHERCNLLPVVSIECGRKPLLSADGIPVDDRSTEFLVSRRHADLWTARWNPPFDQPPVQACRFRVERPNSAPLRESNISPLGST